jgi:DNA polymerase-1
MADNTTLDLKEYNSYKDSELPYKVEYEFIETIGRTTEVLELLSKETVVFFDLETTGLSPHRAKILLVQFSNYSNNYVFDFRKIGTEPFRGLLESKKTLKVIHNAKFEAKMLLGVGIRLKSVFCTMISEQLITAGLQMRGFSLAAVVKKYLGLDIDKSTRLSFVGKEDIEFSEQQLIYSANDTYILISLYDILLDILVRDELVQVALLEFYTVLAIADMEFRGLEIDIKKWKQLIVVAEKKTEEARDALLKELIDIVPQRTLLGLPHINLESPLQIKAALEKLGLKIESTDEKELGKHRDKSKAVDRLLVYRGWAKLGSTYGQAILDRIDETTGRLHSQLWQLGTATGRTSSRNPNQQNIPTYDPNKEVSLDLRACFIARDGYTLIGADYSQQELRIIAELSGDPGFVSAYQKGEDLHRKAAAGIFGVSESKVTKEQRKKAKIFNFGISYGASEYRVAAEFKITSEEALKLINNYYRTFPKLKSFMKSCHIKAISNGYSKTISGRRRNYRIPIQGEEDFGKKLGSIKRQSGNQIIQGSGGDVTKQALVNVMEYAEESGIDAAPILFVHDEIILECKKSDVVACKKMLKGAMIDAWKSFFKKLPMEVDVWESAHWIKG